MRTLTIGFLGTGGIAWMHAKGMQLRPDLFRLKAVADVNAEAGKSFADAFAIPDRHIDYRRVLDDPGIDAVMVLLPHHMHEEACVAAFAKGKHVLVEKPIARTLQEADRIIAAGQGAGRVLMVGLNQRYDGRHQRIRALVEQGVLGRLFCARADHYQNFNPRAAWWRSRDAVGGGCVIGSGIHRLDLLRWYLGEPQEVTAALTYDPARLEGEVAAAATIRFRNGAIAGFLINWGVYASPYCESLGLYGSEGSVTVAEDPGTIVTRPEQDKKLQPLEPLACESMWEHFYRCVTTGACPLTSGSEGRASLALVLGIVRAGQTNQPVRFHSPGKELELCD